jgi:hypothetical protein
MNFKKTLMLMISGLLLVGSVSADLITGAVPVGGGGGEIPEFSSTLVIGLGIIVAGYFVIRYVKSKK